MLYTLTLTRFSIPPLLVICSRADNQPAPETQTIATAPGNAAATSPASGEMCFRQVSGLQKQDTAWVHLNLQADKVTSGWF